MQSFSFGFPLAVSIAVAAVAASYISEPDFMGNRIYLLQNGVHSIHKTLPVHIVNDGIFSFHHFFSSVCFFFLFCQLFSCLDQEKSIQ